MSILVRFAPENLTAEKYDATTKKMEDAGIEWPADGLDIHVCFGPEGNLRVSEIWDSREQFEAFGETLRPMLAEAGIELSGEPEILEIHNIDRR